MDRLGRGAWPNVADQHNSSNRALGIVQAGDEQPEWHPDCASPQDPNPGDLEYVMNRDRDKTKAKEIDSGGVLLSGENETATGLAGLGIIAIDKDRTIRGLNVPAQSLLRVFADAIGSDLLEVLPAWSQHFNVAPGGAAHFGFVLERTGEPPLSVTVASFDNQGGKVIVCRELTAPATEQVRLDQEEIVVRLDSLLARLSHKMRNPLASILAGLQALERAEVLSPDDSFILRLVIGEARNAIGILEGFTNTLRTAPHTIERVPVERLLQNVLTDFDETARKRKITLDVAPGTPTAWVSADEQALTRALEKLVENALDACETGGRICLGWRLVDEEEKRQLLPQCMGDVIVLFGRDTGCGLPLHLSGPSLFEPFVTTKPSRAGLGLPVARQIVKNHGGVVDLHTLEAGGAEFEVFLPLGGRESSWQAIRE